MKRALLAFGILLALLLFGGAEHGPTVEAATPGTTAAPLLQDCPDVDGSGAVRAPDITREVLAFGLDSPGPDYRFIYDLDANGVQRVTDINKVVLAFGLGPGPSCPLVDVQVAKATQWAIDNVPMTQDAVALAAIGYYQAGPDVPGQGVHFVRGTIGGTFDPAAPPRGLVYTDGKLAAQLYVVDGAAIGWTGEDSVTWAGSCVDGADNDSDGQTDAADTNCYVPPSPSGQAPDDVNIDGFCLPAPCSWSGNEGWHLHYNLCTYHIGMPNVSFTLTTSDAACATANNSGCLPQGCGAYVYTPRAGWMGHLWNHLPNKNQIPDGTGANGRFADCFPDTNGWKAYNCPQ